MSIIGREVLVDFKKELDSLISKYNVDVTLVLRKDKEKVVCTMEVTEDGDLTIEALRIGMKIERDFKELTLNKQNEEEYLVSKLK